MTLVNTITVELGDTSGLGLYPLISLFNHSCSPNTECFFLPNKTGDLLFIQATRDIAIGEEVTISYVTENVQGQERRDALAQYGIQHTAENCNLCRD